MSDIISFPEIIWNSTKSKEIKQVVYCNPFFKNVEIKG